MKVRILIDGVPQIDAVTGVDRADYGYASPDVAAAYPFYPQRNNARFRFYLDTTKISNSEHDLLIEVTDAHGACARPARAASSWTTTRSSAEEEKRKDLS